MGRKKKRSGLQRVTSWAWKFAFGIWLLTLLQVFVLKYVNPPLTMTSAWNSLRGGQHTNKLRYSWRPLKKISPHLRRAVLAGEDQRFLSHHGFDFTEMNHAVSDILKKRGVRGASTISMQVARTLFLWKGRSVLRKLVEAYYTVLVELFWNKRRILEMYLNTVDWGKDVMGSEAASRKYFGVSCSSLSRSQAALLAAILPNPHQWSPNRPGKRVLERKKRILKDMEKMPLV